MPKPWRTAATVEFWFTPGPANKGPPTKVPAFWASFIAVFEACWAVLKQFSYANRSFIFTGDPSKAKTIFEQISLAFFSKSSAALKTSSTS